MSTPPRPEHVSIGEAAALYDLTPATLRWWEDRGALDAPARINGDRAYAERDLRRIGLAYLCSVTGMMSLADSAVVTAGSEADATWKDVIHRHIGRLQQTIDEAGAAQRYLRHLLQCQEADMVADCRVLDEQITARTPRGRFTEPDLVTAARRARRAPIANESAAAARGDETPMRRRRRDGTEASPCPGCGGPVLRAATGRPRRHCSAACRQRSYRSRRTRRGSAVGSSAADR